MREFTLRDSGFCSSIVSSEDCGACGAPFLDTMDTQVLFLPTKKHEATATSGRCLPRKQSVVSRSKDSHRYPEGSRNHEDGVAGVRMSERDDVSFWLSLLEIDLETRSLFFVQSS